MNRAEGADRGMVRGLTTDEAVAALTAAGLPTAPIWDIAQAADNEHTQARGLVSQLPHATLAWLSVASRCADGAKPVAAHPPQLRAAIWRRPAPAWTGEMA